MTQFTRSSLQPGVDLYVHPTQKFKTTNVYVYLHTPLQPETVTANALLSMVLGRGSRQFPTTADVVRHLEGLYGAGFGSDVSKRGEAQSLLFRLDVANERYLPGGESVLPEGLKMLFGILTDPLTVGNGLKPEYVDQERQNLKQALEAMINDKRRYAMFRTIQEMCKGENFALDRLGRAEDLPGLTPEALLQRHQELIRDAAIDIFVVGDVEPARIEELVRSALKLPAGGERKRPATAVVRRPARDVQVIKESQDVSQGVLVIGLRTGVVNTDPDFLPLIVANGCLGSYSHSMLFQSVREKNSLAYYAYSGIEGIKGIGYMYAGIEFANYEKAVEIMQAQLKELQRGHIEQELFDVTMRMILGEVQAAGDKAGRMVETQLSNLFAGRTWTLDELKANYEKVTPAQAAEAAKKIQLDTIYFLTKEG